MDDFEKYLRENKSKMDEDALNPEIWTQMEDRLPRPKSKLRKLSIQLMAAAAIFLLGCFSYQFLFADQELQLPPALLAEYGFENQNFSELIELKLEMIRNTPVSADYKNDLQLLLNQAKYLDEQYQDNQQQLNAQDYNENIAKEILQYYKSKAELLDKIIYEIEKINNNEKVFNIKSDKSNLSI